MNDLRAHWVVTVGLYLSGGCNGHVRSVWGQIRVLLPLVSLLQT